MSQESVASRGPGQGRLSEHALASILSSSDLPGSSVHTSAHSSSSSKITPKCQSIPASSHPSATHLPQPFNSQTPKNSGFNSTRPQTTPESSSTLVAEQSSSQTSKASGFSHNHTHATPGSSNLNSTIVAEQSKFETPIGSVCQRPTPRSSGTVTSNNKTPKRSDFTQFQPYNPTQVPSDSSSTSVVAQHGKGDMTEQCPGSISCATSSKSLTQMLSIKESNKKSSSNRNCSASKPDNQVNHKQKSIHESCSSSQWSATHTKRSDPSSRSASQNYNRTSSCKVATQDMRQKNKIPTPHNVPKQVSNMGNFSDTSEGCRQIRKPFQGNHSASTTDNPQVFGQHTKRRNFTSSSGATNSSSYLLSTNHQSRPNNSSDAAESPFKRARQTDYEDNEEDIENIETQVSCANSMKYCCD